MGVFAQAAQQTGGGVFSQAATQAQKPSSFGFGSGPITNSFTGNVAKNVATQYGSAVKSAFNSGIDTSSNAIVDSQKGKNPLETGAQFGAGVVGAAFSPIAPIFSPIGTLINDISNKISDVPQVQKFANSPLGIGVARGVDFANNLNTILGAVASTPGLKTGVAKVAEDINVQKPPNYPPPPPPSAKPVASLTKEWTRPTTVVTATFNKAKAVLAKAPGTPKFLAEQGIDPRAHIEDGRYVTEDTAQALRDTAGKMSEDTLRPSLKAADYSTPPTPVSEIQANAMRRVASEKLATPADKEAIISRINKEAEALKTTYPNGVKLTDMHDNKITYAKNGGYSPIKSASDNNIATANRLLGQAFEDVGTAKTPSDIPVRDFRAYLQQYYRAADYLDALDTKKAPTTLGQKIARNTAKYSFAALGSHFGGDVVSAFAGYSIGKAIEHALENMSNPMRAAFIRNIQQTNPEAYTAVQAYLQKTSTGGGQFPLLRAADSNSPMPLGPSTAKGPSVAPFAEKAGYPLPRDPKTGKVGSQYLSGPK